jgi:hypothetical protein
MIELTMERTKELLAEAVAERGEEYVYTTQDGKQVTPDSGINCFYVHRRNAEGELPEPVAGCIAGLVLHKAGVSLETLEERENEPADVALMRLASNDVIRGESGVPMLLRRVQRRQDKGTAWGTAVANSLAEEPTA